MQEVFSEWQLEIMQKQFQRHSIAGPQYQYPQYWNAQYPPSPGSPPFLASPIQANPITPPLSPYAPYGNYHLQQNGMGLNGMMAATQPGPPMQNLSNAKVAKDSVGNVLRYIDVYANYE